MDFLSYEMSSKVNSKHAREPYTWSQIAERTIWKYFFLLVLYHLGCVLALASYAFGLHSVPMKWWTIIWNMVGGLGISFSISAGAHRLWSHRSYKARLPLRIILMMFYSSAGVYPIYNWVRDHRVHHKYSDTDIDPHNPSRGFFFSHVGWLFMTRLPEALRKLREVDMKDIEADSVVMFEKRYSGRLHLLLYLILPIAIPVTLWNETIIHAVLTQLFLRHVLLLHLALGVNSVGHLWGIRTYNRSINPADNKLLSLATMGEGSHSYHHTFPWDYKSSEDPWRSFNTTALFIELMAKIGLAYDLRGTSPEHIEKVVNRIGYKSKIN